MTLAGRDGRAGERIRGGFLDSPRGFLYPGASSRSLL
jgi:hypothetical protein